MYPSKEKQATKPTARGIGKIGGGSLADMGAGIKTSQVQLFHQAACSGQGFHN